jgi:hypothetical protein
VSQADNGDGPRLMCSMSLGSAHPLKHHRYSDYAYFGYMPSPADCAGRHLCLSSELVPLQLAKVLTPVFGLPGTVNLIALGVIFCVLASAGIAFLAVGLRMRPWAQLLVAAAAWVIMADAAFFDVFASPFSEPATLAGLPLAAAGMLYLGRRGPAAALGLVLAGAGSFLAILSKEQYLILAAPICLTLILASADRTHCPGMRRFLTRQTAAATAVAAVLALLTVGYLRWDIVHYLLTHPGATIKIGQQAANFAQAYRVRALGDYPPTAGYQPHTSESR